jgi:hypothetical protein
VLKKINRRRNKRGRQGKERNEKKRKEKKRESSSSHLVQQSNLSHQVGRQSFTRLSKVVQLACR